MVVAVVRAFFGLADITSGPESQEDRQKQTDAKDQHDIAQNQSAGMTEALPTFQGV
jgi:hypothetical protein